LTGGLVRYMIFVERGEIMTKYDDMTPAARFFHDVAAEPYRERRTSLLDAYKDAVRTGKDERYRYISEANERIPIRRCVVAALDLCFGPSARVIPDDADFISLLPSLNDGAINWDSFDDWIALDNGWQVVTDICLDWEPQWFTDFLEREGYTEKGV